MTEKQYKLEQWTSSSLYYSFPEGNLHHSIGEVIARVENDLNSLYNENEQLKSRVDYLERKIQRERVSYQKQHEKWEKEIQKENEKLKSTIKEVTELLSDEVDLFSDKATEHDIIAYVELKELDNKDAYYMATATKKAIRMLKELQE